MNPAPIPACKENSKLSISPLAGSIGELNQGSYSGLISVIASSAIPSAPSNGASFKNISGSVNMIITRIKRRN